MSLPWIKDYEGQTLENCIVTAKIDGVCCITDGTKWWSRAKKPLYNLPLGMPPGEYECFLGNWAKSVSAVRTRIEGKMIDSHYLYRLRPLDERLILSAHDVVVDKESAPAWLKLADSQGYEGVVFLCNGIGYKLKHKHTIDVIVRGLQYGTGKYKGLMGALLTDYGKVGTGFSDEDRQKFTWEHIGGKLIEVEYMEMTPYGKFRHARFIRIREDK